MADNGISGGAGLREKSNPRRLSRRLARFADKIFRRLDPVRWRSGRYGEMKLPQGEDAKYISLVDGAIPIFSPLLWRFEEEPTADSRFLSLILLAANHRAGSTLLQRICNARKGTLIWGEHNAALRYFTSIYVEVSQFCVAAAEDRERFFAEGENPNLWTASMSPEAEYLQRAIVGSARTFLNALYSRHKEGHDVLGFKEVRYGYNELALLRRCYPEAENLLLVRNPIYTWRSTSSDWYPSLDVWINMWKRAVKSFLIFSVNDPRCHLLRYEDLINKDKKTLALISDTARVSLRRINAVLSNKIGGSCGEIEPADRGVIREQCRKEMELFGYY
ncbi:MAG: sulfotransferase [Pirellulales bacterium]|nr:sulfotransferase [Pirellulales bacterium]